MSQGFYELLGVEPQAESDQIRGAYQRRLAALVRRLRAARKKGADVSILEGQERALREAVEVLTDAARRRRYDAYREASFDGLPDRAEELWRQARGAMVDPVAPAAVAALRSLTALPVGDPLPASGSGRAGPRPARGQPTPGSAPPDLSVAQPPERRAPPPPVVAPVVALPPPPPPAYSPPVYPLPAYTPPVFPTQPNPPQQNPPAAHAQAPIAPPAYTSAPQRPPAQYSPPVSQDEPHYLPPPAPHVDVEEMSSNGYDHFGLPPLDLPLPEPEIDLLDGVDGDARQHVGQSTLDLLREFENYDHGRPGPQAPPVQAPVPQGDEIDQIAARYGFDGRFLRAVRELRGIDLADLSRQTRISQRYLSAIEDSAYESLPAATFVRGYVKGIANVLDVADRGVVEAYMALFTHHRG